MGFVCDVWRGDDDRVRSLTKYYRDLPSTMEHPSGFELA